MSALEVVCRPFQTEFLDELHRRFPRQTFDLVIHGCPSHPHICCKLVHGDLRVSHIVFQPFLHLGNQLLVLVGDDHLFRRKLHLGAAALAGLSLRCHVRYYLPATVEQVVDSRHKKLHSERFGHIAVSPVSHRLEVGVRLMLRSEHYHRDMARGEIVPYVVDKLYPVHLRHHQVSHDYVRLP